MGQNAAKNSDEEAKAQGEDIKRATSCSSRVVSFARAANDTTRAQINNIPSKSHFIVLLHRVIIDPEPFPWDC